MTLKTNYDTKTEFFTLFLYFYFSGQNLHNTNKLHLVHKIWKNTKNNALSAVVVHVCNFA